MQILLTPRYYLEGLRFYHPLQRRQAAGEQGGTGKDEVQVTVRKANVQNQIPQVNAGADISVTMPQSTVTLSGSAKDPDGQIVSFQWKKVAGPAVQLVDADKPTVNLAGFVEGQYTFSLTVADNQGGSASDLVMVIIQPETSTISLEEFAYAGEDQTIEFPITEVILQGTTRDLASAMTEYKWIQLAGPRAKVSDPNLPELTISNIKSPGVLVFQLRVTDPIRGVDVDEVRVIVTEGRRKFINPDKQVVEVTEDPDELDLAHPDEERFKNLSVIVFNDRGEKIFAGTWNDDSYQEVFSKQGFYIYHIIQGDRRLDVGKLIIRP